MRLAVSNIAWAADEANEAYALLQRYGVRGLEIAPGLALPGEADSFAPSDVAIADFRATITHHGLDLVSMQSLLFGASGAQLFGTKAERGVFEAAIERALVFAERLGVPHLVFGSPGNRSFPAALSEREALEQAAETFWRIGERAKALGRTLAIEPNPAIYGTNFLTTLEATARFVARLGHPAIGLNFDVGALVTNEEVGNLDSVLDLAFAHISHVHISEPGLAPAPADTGLLAEIARSLNNKGYDRWYSIEMRGTGSNSLQTLDECIQRAKQGLAENDEDGNA